VQLALLVCRRLPGNGYLWLTVRFNASCDNQAREAIFSGEKMDFGD